MPLAAPTNLIANTVNEQRIDLSWDNNDAYGIIEIYRKKGATGTYSLIDSIAGNNETYSDTGLLNGTTYYYKVRGFTNEDGYSDYSNEASATTVMPAPTDVQATDGTYPDKIVITWTDTTNSEIRFDIYSGVTPSLEGSVGAGVTSYEAYTMEGSDTQTFRVKAVSDYTESDFSNSDTGYTYLPAPSNLGVTQTGIDEVTLTWTDNSQDEVGFEIWRKLGLDGTYALVTTVNANITEFVDTGVSGGNTYYYKVRGYTDYRTSNWSNEVNIYVGNYYTYTVSEELGFEESVDNIAQYEQTIQEELGFEELISTQANYNTTIQEELGFEDFLRHSIYTSLNFAYYLGSSEGKIYLYSAEKLSDDGHPIYCNWESKKLDFVDQYPNLLNTLKTIYEIKLIYFDYGPEDIIISISTDEGKTWKSKTITLGDGSETIKEKSFYFVKTSEYFNFRIEHSSADKKCVILAIELYFEPRGEA